MCTILTSCFPRRAPLPKSSSAGDAAYFLLAADPLPLDGYARVYCGSEIQHTRENGAPRLIHRMRLWDK